MLKRLLIIRFLYLIAFSILGGVKIRVGLLFVLILVSPFCLADSLIFYESLDDQGSLNANGCISCSVTSFSSGIKGNSVYFGAGSSLTYSVLDNIDKNKGTISIWVKPINLNYAGGFFDFGVVGTAPSFGVFKPQNMNEVHFETRTDENTQRNQHKPNAFRLNNWTNVVIVWRTNNASSLTGLYVDGNPVSLWTYSSFDFNPTENYFAVGSTGFYGVANAYLDELKIYDYVKSSAEIRQDYNEVIGYIPPNVTPVKPESKGPVKINGSGLFVNNKPFFMKGVSYQPIPICQNYDYDFFSHPEIYNRDFALLREMNANTIRTWAKVSNENFLDAAYNNGVNPVYVAMGFWIPTDNINYRDPATIESYKTQFRNYVNQFKNYPAVLLWAVGNENNLHYGGDKSDWYNLANELAKVAYEEEGEFYHPVAVVNGDLGYIGDYSANADDNSLNYADIWGVNAYRGYSFTSFLGEYSSLSSKPLWISEFGIDALDNRIGQEYEATQADWNLNLWNDIANSDITIGGTIMEYSDEWQKDWVTNNPCAHTMNCAYVTPNHPDGCSNEEWYGIMRTIDNGANPDIMQPREVYYALKRAFSEHEKFDIRLRDGWNLVSFPLNLTNKSIAHVFRDVGFSSILSYGSWNYYFNEGNNNFNVIDETKGYWVDSLGNQILSIEGKEFDNALFYLDTTWSLLGYTSLSESEISALTDNIMVYMYNNSKWYSYSQEKPSYLNTLDNFIPGYGYWIKKI